MAQRCAQQRENTHNPKSKLDHKWPQTGRMGQLKVQTSPNFHSLEYNDWLQACNAIHVWVIPVCRGRV